VASPEIAAPDVVGSKPFQFGLRSIFVAMTGTAVALGFWTWLGPVDFLWWSAHVVDSAATIAILVKSSFLWWSALAVDSTATIVILVKSKGRAWPGVFVGGLGVAFFVLTVKEFEARFLSSALWFGSLAAFCGGALASDAESKKHSRFLRWARRIVVAVICAMIVLVIGTVGAVVLSVMKYGLIPRA
jgi:hypothetical protein